MKWTIYLYQSKNKQTRTFTFAFHISFFRSKLLSAYCITLQIPDDGFHKSDSKIQNLKRLLVCMKMRSCDVISQQCNNQISLLPQEDLLAVCCFAIACLPEAIFSVSSSQNHSGIPLLILVPHSNYFSLCFANALRVKEEDKSHLCVRQERKTREYS